MDETIFSGYCGLQKVLKVSSAMFNTHLELSDH